MESTQGFSLHSYPYLKLAKTVCLSYCILYFIFNNIGEKEGRTGSAWKWGWQVTQTMYTHVSKCKISEIKNSQKIEKKIYLSIHG
jgi:hypothetical protein